MIFKVVLEYTITRADCLESNRVIEEEEKIPSVFVNVGECLFSQTPVAMKTLLGSCVSVCLFDPFNRFGGMNHILLPGKAGMDDSARFGINAMELLINEFVKKGIPRSRLQAKIIGGGKVLGLGSKGVPIGERNVEFVKDFLRSEEISVSGEETGGQYYRNLRFFTHTFEVYVKRVQIDLEKNMIEKNEAAYLDKLRENMRKKTPTTFF
ncbi:chemotaxis protein CheD [Leptospira haakeii]|uniref:Probable chemoreceptor glutamine deamidase CheD n=1 Tax=Leptospira haakeii TaxID=2023198 RepID=A0ABX4PK28_9LEPT|nr:chemotaxis protein CheD [Leptospira haakeii]PKA19505.1 chemotaxis protein CheD [Leptospira haakeii]